MPPEESSVGASAWLGRAESSLSLARQPKPDQAHWADLCYLTQQAAEKAVKAVYRSLERPFRFTHSLEELGQGLEAAGVDLPDAVREAVVLTRYAVETRYPGIAEPVTEEEYQQAIALADAVVSWARSLIGPAANE